MDEAFIPLHQMILGMTAAGDFRSDTAGVHMYINRLAVETPIELDLTVAEGGGMQIGSVPPLYRVATSVRPTYHKIRFAAELSEMPSDG